MKKMTEKEAITKYPAYYCPKDHRCVICKKKKNDFRFGVCFECASDEPS
jgi:hypothetical protein